MSSWPLAVCVGLAVAMLGALVGIVERTPGGQDIEIAMPDVVEDAPSSDVLSLSSEGAVAPETAGRAGLGEGAEGRASLTAAAATETGAGRTETLPKAVIAAPRTAVRAVPDSAAMEGAPTDRFAVSAPNASRNDISNLARSGVKSPERAAVAAGSIGAVDGARANLTAGAPFAGTPGDGALLPRSVIEPPKRGAVQIEGALSIGGTPRIAVSPRAVQSPRRHVVSRGQTLWVISRAHFGSGIHYRRLFRLNRSRIGNPDRIYPGQVLLLPDIGTDEKAPPASKDR